MFNSKLVNAADNVAFVADAAFDVEFADKIDALIDWIVDNERILFGVVAILN